MNFIQKKIRSSEQNKDKLSDLMQNCLKFGIHKRDPNRFQTHPMNDGF